MIVLGIQTVEFPNSVAIMQSDAEQIEQIVLSERNQTVEKLSDVVDRLLKKMELTVDDIDLVSVCIGPGSYTGSRGGVAFAKGFCQFSTIPLVGVSGFEALQNVITNYKLQITNTVYMMDARNNRVYYQTGDRKADVTSIENVIEQLKADTLFVGSGAEAYKDTISSTLKSKAHFVEENVLTAKNVAMAGHEKFSKGKKSEDVYKIKPLYILPPNITQPKKK